jgi:hypothetical protein
MKHFRLSSLLTLFFVMLLGSGCGDKSNQGDEAPLPADLITNPGSASGNTAGAIIEFVSLEHDFGIIKDGEKVFWNFRFKNTGNAPLLINRVKADCGCTVPDYPRSPIAPGEEGKIKVTFDSKGRMGRQIKQVTVLSNSQRPTNVLTIKAIVEK